MSQPPVEKYFRDDRREQAERLLGIASRLVGDGMGGELGDNNEYERGIAEVLCEFVGLPMQDVPRIIKSIHQRAQEHRG